MTVEAEDNTTVRAEVNGVHYNCKIGGKRGAPWITFAHALANNLTLWDDVAMNLGDRYHTLQFDHPGHGGTPAVPGPYSFDMLIENAVGLWDALGIEASHWVGLSIGGMMGYGLAARYPNRVLSLSACDARPDAPPDYAEYFQYRIDTAREKGMQDWSSRVSSVGLRRNRWRPIRRRWIKFALWSGRPIRSAMPDAARR